MTTKSFWSQRAMLNIRSNKRLFLGCLLAGSVGASAYLFLIPKVYESQAILKNIDPDKQSTSIAAEMIRSPKTIEQSVKGMGLNVEYFVTKNFQTSECFDNKPVKISYNLKDESFSQQCFSLQHDGEKTYILEYEDQAGHQQKRGSYNEMLDLGSLAVTIEKTPYLNLLDDKDEVSFTIYSDKSLANKIAEQNLTCTIEDGGVIKLNSQSTNPAKAYRIASAVSKGYGNAGQKANESHSIANVQLINNQLDRVSQELDNAQRELSYFQSANNAYEMPQQAGAVLNTVSQLQIQKVEADMQIAALDNLSDYMRKNRNVNTISPEYGTITDIIYTETYLKLNDKVAERQQLLEQGADLSKVDKEISSLKEMLAESIRNTRKKLTIRQETLVAAIVSAKDRIQNLPQTEEKLQQLNRSIYLYTKLYDFLIQKRAEAMVEAPVLPPSSYILNEAKMPTSPIGPNPAKVWSLALLASLLFGALITAVKPLLKIKIRNRKDLQKFTDIPFIANIEAGGKKHDFSESFMTLCTKILMLGNKQSVQMITITSAKAGEGKTTIAQNLAMAMGRLGKKALLIDMNPINPSLKNTLGNEEESSFAQVIEDNKNLHQAVQITNYENVDLLSAGYLAHGVNTLLINDKTGNILADMKTLYDYVIFDTPETSNYMDAVPLMKMSDLNMFVVKANSATFDQLEYASQMKKDFQVENLFMIINGMTDTMNHSGMQTSGKVKQIRRREQAEAEIRLMPRIMKKAALWFY